MKTEAHTSRLEAANQTMIAQLCATQKGRAFLVLSVVAVVATASLLYSSAKQREEQQHLARLQQIVQAIQTGLLKPGKQGDIVLPPRFSKLTKNGHVYLSTDPAQPFLLFPEQIDPQDKQQIAGYVYAQVPLPNGWGVSVDDPAVEPVFAETPPKKPNWYYAEPMPD